MKLTLLAYDTILYINNPKILIILLWGSRDDSAKALTALAEDQVWFPALTSGGLQTPRDLRPSSELFK